MVNQVSRLRFKHAAAIVLIAIVAAIQTVPLSARTWKSKNGKYEIEAEFVEFKSGKVHLKKEDGKVVAVSMNALSSTDQRWVRDELRRRKGANTPPDKVKRPTTPDVPSTGSKDWYQWRGPNRDGKSAESGLLQSWEDNAPPLLWSATGLGKGRSSVTVSGGRIFTTGVINGSGHLIALKEADGSPLWRSPIGGSSDVNCTPTVDNNHLIFAVSFDGNLVCAHAETGFELWRRSFSQDFGGKMMSQWGYAESPLVDGERVICTPGGSSAMLAAMEKRTGKDIWRTQMPNVGSRGKDGAGYSSIVISNAGGVKQYVQTVGRGTIGVSAENGQMLWAYNKIANNTANIPTPIVSGDYIFCSTGYQTGAALLRLSRGGRGVTAKEVYFLPHNKLQNHHGGMIQLGEYLYCGHGHNEGFPVCIHLPTGRSEWAPGRGPGRRSAAVSYADGHLYFRYEDGTMALIEANPKEFRLKGTFKIATRHAESWPHPVIANGKLYLRDQDALHCYDVRAKP
jgi:outer membrane protein assembly factor BamB